MNNYCRNTFLQYNLKLRSETNFTIYNIRDGLRRLSSRPIGALTNSLESWLSDVKLDDISQESEVICNLQGRKFQDLNIRLLAINGTRKFPHGKRYYGLRLHDQNLTPQSLVLIGGNGVGKSTFYDALEYIALNRVGEAQLRGLPNYQAFMAHGGNATKTANIQIYPQGVADLASELPLSSFFCSEHDLNETISRMPKHPDDDWTDFFAYLLGLNDLLVLKSRLRKLLENLQHSNIQEIIDMLQSLKPIEKTQIQPNITDLEKTAHQALDNLEYALKQPLEKTWEILYGQWVNYKGDQSMVDLLAQLKEEDNFEENFNAIQDAFQILQVMLTFKKDSSSGFTFFDKEESDLGNLVKKLRDHINELIKRIEIDKKPIITEESTLDQSTINQINRLIDRLRAQEGKDADDQERRKQLSLRIQYVLTSLHDYIYLLLKEKFGSDFFAYVSTLFKKCH